MATTEQHISEATQGEAPVIARRRFLKGAVTIAWATPVILTVTATPALACGSHGQVCPASGCCTGLTCCSNTATNTNLRGKCGYGTNQGPDTCSSALCCSQACKTTGPTPRRCT